MTNKVWVSDPQFVASLDKHLKLEAGKRKLNLKERKYVDLLAQPPSQRRTKRLANLQHHISVDLHLPTQSSTGSGDLVANAIDWDKVFKEWWPKILELLKILLPLILAL